MDSKRLQPTTAILWLLLLSPRVARSALTTTKNLTYSFKVQKPWGTLKLEEANCCPQLDYPVNRTLSTRPLPHVIGIGVQKGGSTSVANYLRLHSSYQSSTTKELHFFDQAISDQPLWAYATKWKTSIKRNATKHVRFEFTPNYIWFPMVACRVKYAMPHVKLIVVLRDPVARAFSEFNMVRSTCKERAICPYNRSNYVNYVLRGIRNLEKRQCTFNDGKCEKIWNDCFQCLIEDSSVYRRCLSRSFCFYNKNERRCLYFGVHLVSRGLYAAQLAWWFQLLPPKNFIIINSHELFKDPVKEMNRVNEFVGIREPFTMKLTKTATNVGKYGRYNDADKEMTKQLLSSFYTRPNQELYKLLDEVGLGPFTPFETATAPKLQRNVTNNVFADSSEPRSTFVLKAANRLRESSRGFLAGNVQSNAVQGQRQKPKPCDTGQLEVTDAISASVEDGFTEDANGDLVLDNKERWCFSTQLILSMQWSLLILAVVLGLRYLRRAKKSLSLGPHGRPNI